ncbi:MAG: FAD-dependent oxidoreductase [Thermodesulfobacteriota bacterium]
MPAYPLLFSPFSFKGLSLANRIVMPPMATNFAGRDGAVNDLHLAYYGARAQGGAGYITCEHTGVAWEGKAFEGMTLLHQDQNIAGFARLADAVHQAGAKLVIQINHAGRQTSKSIIGTTPLAVSPIPCPLRQEPVQELSLTQIQELVQAFGRAAKRVQQAGADGVEVHMAHGYLLSTFLSPFANQRRDQYGDDFAGRLRAPLEVLAEVRRRVGPDFPVICRISAAEFVLGGLTLADSQRIAQALVEHGADAIHVSGGIPAAHHFMIPSYYVDEACFADLGRGIKQAVAAPVILVGRIRTPQTAERLLKEGRADLIAMGRALIADPELPNKARQGRPQDICPCISCMRCTASIREGGLRCAVNPAVGREARFATPNPPAKKVWVVGGGPGGMKAAEVAARRGHQVSLFDKSGRLGGKMLLAGAPPYKSVLLDWVRYMTGQLQELPVQLHLNQELDPARLGDERPEVVIVASGGRPLWPPIPGLATSGAVAAEEVLSGAAAVGPRVLIVGGGAVGCELADLLSQQGKEVTLVEMREGIALEAHAHFRHFLGQRLAAQGVRVLTSCKAVGLEPGGLWVEGPAGKEKLSGFDHTVVCLGWQPDDGLAKALQAAGLRTRLVGDAAQNGEIMDAVRQGAEAALEL